MYASPSTVRARRLLASLLAIVMAATGLVLGSATPAHAAPANITGGYIDWGVKSSFRNYLFNLVTTDGTATLAATSGAPALTNPPLGAAPNNVITSAHTYRFGILPTGSDDAATKQANVTSGGSVRFQKHAGELDVKIDQVRVNISGTTGTVVADVTSKQFGGPEPELVLYDDVELVSLDLTSVTPTVSGGTVTYANIPAVLTAAGAPAFAGFYPAGEAFDPITLSIRQKTPSPAPVNGTPVTGVVRSTFTGNIWSGTGSLNQCAVALDGATLHGTPANGADFNNPASGFEFPVGSGSYDEATGAVELDLVGAFQIGNHAQGGYRMRFEDLRATIDAAGNGVLTADLGYSLAPTGPLPEGAPPCNRPYTFTPVGDDIQIASFTGTLANDDGEVTGAFTPPFAANNFRIEPAIIAALPASLQSHFYVSNGNPGSPNSSVIKATTPIRFELELKKPAAVADFDGDGLTDVSVFRNGHWHIQGQTTVAFGQAGDIPVPGQWDADAQTDIAVFRPSTGRWYVQGQPSVAFGQNGDIPVPGDYNGDGLTDIALFRNGHWHIQGQTTVAFGQAGDIPVPGQWDADPQTDIAVFRPTTGRWYLQGQPSVAFGQNGDIPVPGDYNGDGLTDIAVFRPSTGRWYVQGQPSVAFGQNGDIPVPGQWDADPQTDIAVFRPTTGRWYLQGQPSVAFGQNGDIPLPARPTA